MPQPNFESSEWKDEEFDPPEWESWYGEGAVECSDVFDIHVTLQANYYRAERRANGILEQDDLDITAVREYLSSIYEQASLGYVERIILHPAVRHMPNKPSTIDCSTSSIASLNMMNSIEPPILSLGN